MKKNWTLILTVGRKEIKNQRYASYAAIKRNLNLWLPHMSENTLIEVYEDAPEIKLMWLKVYKSTYERLIA